MITDERLTSEFLISALIKALPDTEDRENYINDLEYLKASLYLAFHNATKRIEREDYNSIFNNFFHYKDGREDKYRRKEIDTYLEGYLDGLQSKPGALF